MWAYSGYNGLGLMLLQQNNKVSFSGSSALHCAVRWDNHEGLAALLARHDDMITSSINQRNDDGQTPIMRAIFHNSVNCFHLLLANPKVDLDARDDYERPLHEVRG